MEFFSECIVNPDSCFTSLLGSFVPPHMVGPIRGLSEAALLIMIGLTAVLFLTWGERKVVGRMQDRIGPNRWGPYGILQPLADGIKMFTKEDIVPDLADRPVHLLASIIVIIPALLVYAVLPFGQGLWGADLNIGVLYVVALSNIGAIAILMAGWSSHNKYSLLGAFRVVAQVITYEIPLVISMVAVVMLSGSMSMVSIVESQDVANFVIMPVVFLVFMFSATAELYRAPFDMIEADSELVAGFFTEYSGMKFVMFFMAEYVNLLAMSGIITTLFLGGWRFFGLEELLPTLGPVIFFSKSAVIIFLFWWIRSTFPRIRIDHMMNIAWKALVPISLVNLMVVGLVDKIVAGPAATTAVLLAVNLAAAALLLKVFSSLDRRAQSRMKERVAARKKSVEFRSM